MSNSRYAVAIHILVAIANFEKLTGQVMRSEDIAGSVDTNAVVIRRIIKKLKDAGLVMSQPGVNGGSSLARPAAEITLCDVYQAMIEDIDLFPVHTGEQTCMVGANIDSVLKQIFGSAEVALENSLSQTTIAEVLARTVEK